MSPGHTELAARQNKNRCYPLYADSTDFSEQPPFWLLYPNHSGNCGLCFVSADHKLILRLDGPETEVCKTLIKIPNTVSVQTPGKKEEGTVCNYSIEAPKGSRILYR